jgi:hypothetical protein
MSKHEHILSFLCVKFCNSDSTSATFDTISSSQNYYIAMIRFHEFGKDISFASIMARFMELCNGVTRVSPSVGISDVPELVYLRLRSLQELAPVTSVDSEMRQVQEQRRSDRRSVVCLDDAYRLVSEYVRRVTTG